MVSNEDISPLFDATALATEESVINALVASDTMTGANSRRVIGLPHDRLREVLRKYNRLVTPAS
jgi:L-aminopeptidase/D-esterase-like protein